MNGPAVFGGSMGVELLSPAGNPEKLRAAVLYGADAVYLAGRNFGMRSAADNFSNEELAEAVRYAHQRGVRVYLAVNTMPRTDEYPALEKYFEAISDFGIDAFIAALPIEKFFGIGKVTALKMHELGIQNGADLRLWDEPELVKHFGKAGHNYYEYARGIDTREVTPDRKRKSLGAETTFAEDIGDKQQLANELHAVCMDVWRRMDKHNFRGKTVTLKLKYNDFKQITRSKTLPCIIDEPEQLQQISRELLDGAETGTRKIRLLGVSVGNVPETADAMQLQIDFGDM